MKDIILLKQGETVLKGLNRRYFEQKLVSNIRKRLKPMGEFRVYCVQSTVYVEPESETADMDAAFDALSKTFGVVALSRAAACEKDEDAIARLAIEYLREDMLAAESFKVETKRADKRFPMTSIQLSQCVLHLCSKQPQHSHAGFQLKIAIVPFFLRYIHLRQQIPFITGVNNTAAVLFPAAGTIFLHDVQRFGGGLLVVRRQLKQPLTVGCYTGGHGSNTFHLRP